METIVDQLKTVNSKSFLEEIKNPENVKILTLENYNNSTKWNDLEKFINLEQLQLKNCFISPVFLSFTASPNPPCFSNFLRFSKELMILAVGRKEDII